MSHFCKTHFAILLISTLLLSGCWYKSLTENIIDQHVQLVDQALAAPEMSDKAKDALKTCKAGLLSAEQTYKSEIAKCHADTRYWKTVSAFLGIIMLLYVGFKIMKR